MNFSLEMTKNKITKVEKERFEKEHSMYGTEGFVEKDFLFVEVAIRLNKSLMIMSGKNRYWK